MVPWVPLATVQRPLGQQNTLKSIFSGPNRGITVEELKGVVYIPIINSAIDIASLLDNMRPSRCKN